MPFTKTEDRIKMLTYRATNTYPDHASATQPGDWCFFYYHQMMEHWKRERRWTTAHNIYVQMRRDLSLVPDLTVEQRGAYELAWQVFFQLQVIPYELEKQAENGDITGDEFQLFKSEDGRLV